MGSLIVHVIDFPIITAVKQTGVFVKHNPFVRNITARVLKTRNFGLHLRYNYVRAVSMDRYRVDSFSSFFLERRNSAFCLFFISKIKTPKHD